MSLGRRARREHLVDESLNGYYGNITGLSVSFQRRLELFSLCGQLYRRGTGEWSSIGEGGALGRGGALWGKEQGEKSVCM